MPGKSGRPGDQVAGKLSIFLGNLREKNEEKKGKEEGKIGNKRERSGKKENDMWKHEKVRNEKNKKEGNGTNYE